jgi:RNA polymerase sigma-70 factor (ECF subfamily)
MEARPCGAYHDGASLLYLDAWRIGGSPAPAPPEPAVRSGRPEGGPLSADQTLQDALHRLREGGDAEACFAVLDARLRPRLLAYFRADAASREEADDLAQKTLARVVRGVAGLRAEESFMAWLFTIARNVRRTALGHRRRAALVIAGSIEMAGDPKDPRPTPLEDGLEAERLAALRTAIEQLPRQQRQCLLLRFDRELSYEDLAATLGLSVHTVRNHLALARKSLRRVLGAAGSEGREP